MIYWYRFLIPGDVEGEKNFPSISSPTPTPSFTKIMQLSRILGGTIFEGDLVKIFTDFFSNAENSLVIWKSFNGKFPGNVYFFVIFCLTKAGEASPKWPPWLVKEQRMQQWRNSFLHIHLQRHVSFSKGHFFH